MYLLESFISEEVTNLLDVLAFNDQLLHLRSNLEFGPSRQFAPKISNESFRVPVYPPNHSDHLVSTVFVVHINRKVLA